MASRVFILKQYLYDLVFGHCWTRFVNHPIVVNWKISMCSRCHRHRVLITYPAEGEKQKSQALQEGGANV